MLANIRAAADDLFYSIHRRDWVGAFAGLFDALKRIQTEFAKAGNTSGKIGAVAGAAQAVGSAVGGKGGAALSGAAGGALTGFQVGGPVGAVVGGILGGLGGLFGASKAKKRAKREAAEQARLEKERAAAELAAAKRELELKILGFTSGALAEETERRKDLLAAMDPSLRALQEEFWAREDAANAVAKRVALERELLRLTNEAAAVEADRADVLKDLTPEAAALQRSIFAAVDAMAAQEAANDAYLDAQAEEALGNAIINQSNVLQRLGAQLDAAAQQLNAALQQAAANVNATPPAPQIAQIDAASISDALTAADGPPLPDTQDGFALLAAKMDQVLAASIATGVNTWQMSRDLDDVIRGNLSINTNAA